MLAHPKAVYALLSTSVSRLSVPWSYQRTHAALHNRQWLSTINPSPWSPVVRYTLATKLNSTRSTLLEVDKIDRVALVLHTLPCDTSFKARRIEISLLTYLLTYTGNKVNCDKLSNSRCCRFVDSCGNSRLSTKSTVSNSTVSLLAMASIATQCVYELKRYLLALSISTPNLFRLVCKREYTAACQLFVALAIFMIWLFWERQQR